MSALSKLKASQVAWAESCGKRPVRGYVASRNANLWRPLSASAEKGLADGSGSELTEKIRALYSSSALVVNFFDYWETAPERGALMSALGVGPSTKPFAFESQHPTGLPGNPPNLDLVIEVVPRRFIAIESKFSEWISPDSSRKRTFKPKYFPRGRQLWANRDLVNCQSLAESVHAGRDLFEHLDVHQLLKHALGLATTLGTSFSLFYLYYDWPCEEAEIHRGEIELFRIRVGHELRFEVHTYQELFQKLEASGAVDFSYVEYLRARYFPVAGKS